MLLASLLCLVPTPAPSSEDALVDRLRAVVEAAAEADTFSGAVLVARGDEVLLRMAAGEASKRFHVPNAVTTRFNLGSMNKMFTAVACARLVEEGKLAYDDPISRWVDETWLPREMTDKITVAHLLSHTSGLGSYFNERFMETARDTIRELEDYKPLVREETLAFEPGTSWSYSNTGMLLAGVVIEGASGQSYFDYVREHVYGPAGMTRTDCYDMDEPVEDLAIGYARDPEAAQGFRNNLYMHVVRGGPAGGGFSTVDDLYAFGRALLDGTLLSVESLEELWTDRGTGYGYGFGISQTPLGLQVGHSGGFPGISSNLDVLVESDLFVVVLSNYDGGMRAVRPGLLEVLREAE